MNNFESGSKVKALRIAKGLSQDELAQQAGISLRTVQRIENNETEPRGDTLKRLATALYSTPGQLIEKPEPADKNHIALLNLSAITFIAFPLLGILIPLLIWVLYKTKVKNMEEAGKRLLNFQISWCIVYFLIIGAVFTAKLEHMRFLGFGTAESTLLCIYGLYAINILFIVINTIRALKSLNIFYQPALPFIR